MIERKIESRNDERHHLETQLETRIKILYQVVETRKSRNRVVGGACGEDDPLIRKRKTRRIKRVEIKIEIELVKMVIDEVHER